MPFHSSRQWRVEEGLGPLQVATRIASHSWCGCVGFLCEGVLWLNDSTGPDGAQEWAVVRASDGRQCESITTGWCDKEKDIASILETQKRYSDPVANPMFGEGHLLGANALNHPEGDCHLCA